MESDDNRRNRHEIRAKRQRKPDIIRQNGRSSGDTSNTNRQKRDSTAGNSQEDYTPSNRRRKGRIFRGTFVPRRGRSGSGDKNVAKGDDRLSDGTKDEKKSPYSAGERGIGEPSRAGSEQGDTMRGGMPPRLADGLFYFLEVDVLGGGVATVGGVV